MDRVIEIIKELNGTNSTLEKKEILKKYVGYEYFTKILVLAYHPLTQFNVSSANVKKYMSNKNYDSQKFWNYPDIFELLGALSHRRITGNEALKSINEFLSPKSEEYKTLVYNILDKNLKIRVSHKIINKVYGYNVIDVFDPVLSYKYDPKFTELDDSWFVSQKLDGVRCLIKVDPINKVIKTYSRTGKDLYNTELIIAKIPISKFKNVVFLDGEIVSIDDNGKENFTNVIEIVRKKGKVKDVSGIYYKIFDIIPEKVFLGNEESVVYSKRFKKVKSIFKDNHRIKIVDQLVYSESNFSVMTDKSKELGWEGLMVRKDTVYKSGRTRDLGKIKSFFDEEFVVTDTISGPFRVIDSDTGLEKTITCLAAVYIDYKTTKVGSGFSIDQRKMYHKNPALIIGKSITVQYFEKTPDSLRFPTFKGIRDYE